MNAVSYSLDELDSKLTNVDLKGFIKDCGAQTLPETVFVVDEKQLKIPFYIPIYLFLFTAGRSIAARINNNELPIINGPSFGYYGNFIPGIPIPTPIFIAIICMIIASALPAYKAIVVIILVVLSAPVVREKLAALKKELTASKSAVKEAKQ